MQKKGRQRREEREAEGRKVACSDRVREKVMGGKMEKRMKGAEEADYPPGLTLQTVHGLSLCE